MASYLTSAKDAATGYLTSAQQTAQGYATSAQDAAMGYRDQAYGYVNDAGEYVTGNLDNAGGMAGNYARQYGQMLTAAGEGVESQAQGYSDTINKTVGGWTGKEVPTRQVKAATGGTKGALGQGVSNANKTVGAAKKAPAKPTSTAKPANVSSTQAEDNAAPSPSAPAKKPSVAISRTLSKQSSASRKPSAPAKSTSSSKAPTPRTPIGTKKPIPQAVKPSKKAEAESESGEDTAQVKMLATRKPPAIARRAAANTSTAPQQATKPASAPAKKPPSTNAAGVSNASSKVASTSKTSTAKPAPARPSPVKGAGNTSATSKTSTAPAAPTKVPAATKKAAPKAAT
jgi:hypothetical protein